MQPRGPITTDLVLLGAGHAHVEVLRRFAMRPEPGMRLTLIAREPETLCCAMLPGLIRGDYRFDEAHVDLGPLSVAAGARLVVAEATAIDLAARAVSVLGRPPIAFDLLSINVGGESTKPGACGLGVKPIGRFLDRLSALEAALPRGSRIALAGGGVAETELALALAGRFRGRFRLVLVCDTPEPVAEAPAHARRAVRAALVSAGVELVSGVQACALTEGRLPLSDGSFLEADAVLWAAGAVAPAFLAESGLECDTAGRVRVDAGLRSLGHAFVFAAGDCATPEGRPSPKPEVWARRAGAPLAANLRRAAQGKAARPWRPQRDALAMLGLGGTRAVAWRYGLAVSGSAIWRCKDWMDRRWVRRHSIGPMPRPDEAEDAVHGGAELHVEVLANGFAGQHVGLELGVPAGAVAGASGLAMADLLTGLDAPDDAAVLKLPAGQVLVQTIECLRTCLDDPFVFGQIAAAHALSAQHAKGARPWTALAIATVPGNGDSAKMRAELGDMLAGARKVLAADGCTLIGGHSAEAPKPSLGFAVSGLADPRKLLRKCGLRVGDALVLTKPLGTGIVLAGHARGEAHVRWLIAATDSMRATNAAASRVLLAHGATACTDVAGSGLAGHLGEMLRASGVAAVLWPEVVPALPGALELAAAGIAGTVVPHNAGALPDGAADPRSALLVDPQTSGGLLAGVPSRKAKACVAALRDAGLRAAVVGEVEAAAAGTKSLRLDER